MSHKELMETFGWMGAAAILAAVLTSAVFGAEEEEWTPADGPPEPTAWISMNGGPAGGIYEITLHPDDGLPVLYVYDDDTTTYSRGGYNLFDPHGDCTDEVHPFPDAVYEFTAQTLGGAWSCGILDWKKSMLLTMTVDRVGIRDFDGSWLVFVNVDTSDQLHTFRVEKHGKDFLRILMDGEELFVVGYCTLFDRNNEEASTSFGNAGALALTMVEDTAEFYHAGYRHLVGATSFPDDEEPNTPGPRPRISVQRWAKGQNRTPFFD